MRLISKARLKFGGEFNHTFKLFTLFPSCLESAYYVLQTKTLGWYLWGGGWPCASDLIMALP